MLKFESKELHLSVLLSCSVGSPAMDKSSISIHTFAPCIGIQLLHVWVVACVSMRA